MIKKHITLLLYSFLFISAMVNAQEKPYYLSEMSIPGTARDRIVADINGDKAKDLIMIYTKAEEEKVSNLAVFIQKQNGFAPTPDQQMRLSSNYKTFDVGEVAEAPGEELVVYTSDGIFYFDKQGNKLGELKPLVAGKNIFSGSEYNPPSHQKFLWDIDGDGISEILAPTLAGPIIYKRSGNGYAKFEQLNLPAKVGYKIGSWGDITVTDDINQFLRFREYQKRTSITYTVPDLFVEDFNGDKRKDIVGILKNDLWVFCQDADGKFPSSPCVHFNKSVLTSQEKKLGFVGEALTFADLNNDGMGDIIKVKYGSQQQRVQITYMIFYARAGLKYGSQADQKISSTGFRADFGVYDFNLDGKLDIVVPYFHFAPAQAFKVMTENAVKIQFRIFIMKQDGRYTQGEGMAFAKPDQRQLVNYRINIFAMITDPQALIKGDFNPLIHFGADVNGDGYPDLVADSGADKLNIYYGNQNVSFSPQPNLVIPLESAWAFDFKALNNDKKQDLITYYESEERVKEKKKILEQYNKNLQRQEAKEPQSEEVDELAKIAQTKEETRIKVLIWK